MLVLGMLFGLIHGLLITRIESAALHRDAVRVADLSRCGALLHRGRHRRFRLRRQLSTLEWLTTGRLYGRAACLHRHAGRAAIMWWCCTVGLGRYLYAVARTRRRRVIPDSHKQVIVAAYVHLRFIDRDRGIFLPCIPLDSPSSHGNFYELYAIAARCWAASRCGGGEGSVVGVGAGRHPDSRSSDLVTSGIPAPSTWPMAW